MSKVDKEYDNPIDNIVIDIGEPLMPYLRKLGQTPNMLTTYSFIFGLASIYFLYIDKIYYFAISFAFSYIFDCWDGFMARKYNMATKFGDLYDHTTDLVVALGLAYVIYKKYRHKITTPIIIVALVITYFMEKHVGCFQKYYIDTNKERGEETIDFLTRLCPDKNDIKWTRFFGPGTYITMFILSVMYMNLYL
jgi:hypothetical protein